ncbi:uncharacterized protein HD556DRAFT_1441880 [Suillus plorans]|uniref:Uncharacterized protein n=1 Tax=Suillus plorans TaxID=116603 RepID=A0A9P7DJP7_9AGAM|nr:uncharacterized protein HD556DRAFT_1441880 [Suillus plorans]KAG1796045.1 hypothetical protein HD556DRAFT_1441880 [Suillus plorans]
MAPRRWASSDEEEFVNTFYEKYQYCQARRDYTTFWNPFYEAWGAKFPEWLVVFPEIPLDKELNVEQKQIVSAAYDRRKLQLMNKLRNNWGSSKASRKAKNTGEKTRQSLIASITAPQRARSLQSHEAYSKLYFATCVKPAVDAEMQRLQHVANLAKLGNGTDEEGEKDLDDTTTGDPSSSSMEKEVKAEVAAYIEQLNEKKSQDLEAAKTGEGIDHQVTIDRLVDILAEFFQELERLTGWSFSVLMGGPTPALGGKINVSSFHVGCTEMGNLFSDAYPDFNSTIMKPWVEFINHVHPTAAAKGLKRYCSVESMNNISLEKGTGTMSKSVNTMAMSGPSNSNVTATTLLPPLDESDELNLLADGFFASNEYSQLHNLDFSILQPQLPPSSALSSSNSYSSINPYDDFSWMLSALQPPTQTSGQGEAYAPRPGLILPQPSPPPTYPSPRSMCAPTPSTTTLESTLSQSILPAKLVCNPPSLTEFLQDVMKKPAHQSPAPTDKQAPSCPPQVSMNAPPEMTQTVPLARSLPGAPPSQILLPGVIHSQTPLLPEGSTAPAVQNPTPPAVPTQSSPPSSTTNSASPSTVGVLTLPAVDQTIDSPDVAPTYISPHHASKRCRHHDSNKGEVSDGLVTGRSNYPKEKGLT